jgi:hypothetical protein
MSVQRGVLVVAALVFAGCQSKGENLPLEEARNRFPAEPIEHTTVRAPDAPPVVAAPPVIAFGRQWMPHGGPQRIPAALLAPVAAGNGVALHAAAWDRPPYARLLAPVGPDQWIEYRETGGGPAVTGGQDLTPGYAETDPRYGEVDPLQPDPRPDSPAAEQPPSHEPPAS